MGRIIFTLEEDKGQYNSAEDIFWASGAALVYYTSHLDLLATLAAFFGGIVGFLQSPSFINRPLSKYHSAEKLASTLIYPRSIAIEYFLRGKRTYHELLGKTKPREIKTKRYQEFG